MSPRDTDIAEVADEIAEDIDANRVKFEAERLDIRPAELLALAVAEVKEQLG